ncbi:MAG: hypothetical protein PHV82_12055, partial [Victivallaceae bacterium]|nr:hypothetical protein [Victivallaceae bacterium]
LRGTLLFFPLYASFAGEITWLSEGEAVSLAPDACHLAGIAGGKIWIINIGNGARRLLIDLPEKLRNPVFTDAAVFCEGARGILRVSLSDGKIKFIDQGTELNISPDGTEIAYSKEGSIWIMEIANGNKKCIVPNKTLENNSPVWSRDGKSLFFIQDYSVYRHLCGTKENVLLFKGKITGKGLTRYFIALKPSPADKDLLLTSLSSAWRADEGEDSLLLMDLDKKTEKQIGEGSFPCWFFNARGLVFSLKGALRVWRNGKVADLTDGKFDEQPHISRDGKYIIFVSRRKDTNNDGILNWKDKKQIYRLDCNIPVSTPQLK